MPSEEQTDEVEVNVDGGKTFYAKIIVEKFQIKFVNR